MLNSELLLMQFYLFNILS